MTVSQKIESILAEQNEYDDDITITDIPGGNFIAVTGMSIDDGSSTRDIRVTIMPLEGINESTQTVNSGMFIRKDGETAIKVTVYDNSGTEKASNTTDYP